MWKIDFNRKRWMGIRYNKEWGLVGVYRRIMFIKVGINFVGE